MRWMRHGTYSDCEWTKLNLKNTGYANPEKRLRKNVGILFEMFFFRSGKKHQSKHIEDEN